VINPVGNDLKDQNGRNVVPVTLQEEMRVAGDAAKRVIKERIVGLVSHGVGDAGQIDTADVYLFPCGMSAMFNTHRALLEAIPGHDFDGQTVSFG
jgi:cystathionine beta-lyase/cystathionine gamma-synthase